MKKQMTIFIQVKKIENNVATLVGNYTGPTSKRDMQFVVAEGDTINLKIDLDIKK